MEMGAVLRNWSESCDGMKSPGNGLMRWQINAKCRVGFRFKMQSQLSSDANQIDK